MSYFQHFLKVLTNNSLRGLVCLQKSCSFGYEDDKYAKVLAMGLETKDLQLVSYKGSTLL